MTDFSPSEAVTTEDVQPAEGQGVAPVDSSEVQPSEGQGQSGVSLYEEALSTVPSELREHVEPHFKAWDKAVQAKLTEAAEQRKQFEPYAEIVSGIDPEGLGNLLAWAEQLDPEDPDATKAALLSLAESLAVDLGIAAPVVATDDQGAAPAVTREEIEAEVRAAMEAERERATFEAEIKAAVDAEIKAVETDFQASNGREMNEEERKQLMELAGRFAIDTEQPVRAAFDLIRQVSGAAQNQLVASAADQPNPAVPGGRASTAVTPPETFEEARQQMTDRRRAAATA